MEEGDLLDHLLGVEITAMIIAGIITGIDLDGLVEVEHRPLNIPPLFS